MPIAFSLDVKQQTNQPKLNLHPFLYIFEKNTNNKSNVKKSSKFMHYSYRTAKNMI